MTAQRRAALAAQLTNPLALLEAEELIVLARAGIASNSGETRMSKSQSEAQKATLAAQADRLRGKGSNNPGGRPKMKPELRLQAQEFTQEILDVWAECLRDPQARWADRIRSGELMMNRGWGMATQQVNLDVAHTVSLTNVLERIQARQLAQNEPPVIEAQVVETPKKD